MKRIILILSIFFISLFISNIKLTQYLELKSKDIRSILKGERIPPSEIVIVDIDDASYDALEMRFPWHRSIYAGFLKNLKKAGAKMVVFDIEFDVPDSPLDDTIFAGAIKDFGKVILGAAIRTGIIPTIIYPIEPFRKYANVGMLNKLYDMDGVIRRYPLRISFNDSVYNSVALTAFSQLNRSENLPISNTITMDFYGPAKRFPYYSFWTVVDDKDFRVMGIEDTPDDVNAFDELLQDSVFYNKIVLVGSSIEELHDLYQTPFFNYKGEKKLMPGVELHATALANLIEGRRMKEIQGYFNILFLLLLAIIFAFFNYDRIYLSLFSLFSIIILIIFLSLFIFIKGLYIQLVPLIIVSIVGYSVGMIERFVKTRKEKEWITSIFGKYVSKDIVQTILKNPDIIKLGGETKKVTVLFSDIEKFTTFSEKTPPEKLVEILNIYFERLTHIIINYGGMIDKFEGDAIMAVFGLPLSHKDDAERAVLCALKMQEEIDKMIKSKEIPLFRTRIGINTGEAIAGNLGSSQRMNYTVIGDTVNLASRLEGINKLYKTNILMGENTYKEVFEKIICREVDKIRVIGKKIPISIYEPVDKTLKDKYEIGLEYYRNKEWIKAKVVFSQLVQEYKDGVSQSMIERIEELQKTPPPEDWDGVFTFEKKY